jgi:hypothetical protein
MLSRSIKVVIQTLLLIVIIETSVTAQLSDMSSSGGSPVWGVSPIQGDNGIGQNLRDPNWGILPSRQSLNANNSSNSFGRTAGNSNSNQSRRLQSVNVNGQQVLMDANGNIVYDAQGQAIQVDSTGGILGPNDPILDPPSINIPDDPLDVPLDGGAAVLITIATGIAYRNRKMLV